MVKYGQLSSWIELLWWLTRGLLVWVFKREVRAKLRSIKSQSNEWNMKHGGIINKKVKFGKLGIFEVWISVVRKITNLQVFIALQKVFKFWFNQEFIPKFEHLLEKVMIGYFLKQPLLIPLLKIWFLSIRFLFLVVSIVWLISQWKMSVRWFKLRLLLLRLKFQKDKTLLLNFKFRINHCWFQQSGSQH